MLTYLRSYLEGYGFNLNEKLSKIFRNYVGNYYIDCYEQGKALSCMYGK